MNTDSAYELIKICLTHGAMITAPFVIVALTTGILISLFQTITSIQEQTLTFVPKLLVAGISLWLMAPWVLERLGQLLILMFEKAGEVSG